MPKPTVPRLAAVVLAASLAATASGQEMAERLTTPATVPLEFLTWIDRDDAWLAEALGEAGVGSEVEIGPKGVASATTEAALRVLNRIRAFAHLAVPGLRPPYFDLSVSDPSGTSFRCVTLFPKSVAPQIGPMDFTEQSFPSVAADPMILDLCRVDPKQGGDYRGLARDEFRARYFDEAGNLRVEFANLNSDAGFVAEAIDQGFLVRQGDVTGRLKLERE